MSEKEKLRQLDFHEMGKRIRERHETAVSGAVYSEPDCQPDLCSICHHHMAVWSAVFRDAVSVHRCHVEAVPASGATGFHGKSR